MATRNPKATPKPPGIDSNANKRKTPRLPMEDQEVAGLDAEGNPVYRRKASAIPGPRAGKSNRGRK